MKKQFLNPTVTVDIVLLTIENDRLKVLLIKRENAPYKGAEALPGGYLFQGETTKDAALRVLGEKAGVTDVYLEQLYTFDTPGRDPRGPVFSVAYLALVPFPLPILPGAVHTQTPELYDIARLPKLAFDHRSIVTYAIERIRGKLEYTTIGCGMLPEYFTLSDLQKVYEVILGKKLDKRNFRKKIDQLGFLKETKEKQTGKRQRPAKLYTLKSKDLKIF